MEQNTSVKSVNREPMKNVEEIDLLELFFMLLYNWKLILAAALVGAILAGSYHQFMLKPSYKADAKLYITNTDSMISFSDLQLSAALTEDYADIIQSRTVLKRVIRELDLDMNFRQLNNLISVSNPDKTHIIHITVTCSDMEMSRNIANALLNISVDQIYQVIRSSEPTIIDAAEADAVVDTTPGLLRYLMMGALLAAFLVCALLVARELLDTTLHNEEDVEKYLRLPVLSSVPYYQEKKHEERESA